MPLLRRKGGGIRSFLLQQWTFKEKSKRENIETEFEILKEKRVKK